MLPTCEIGATLLVLVNVCHFQADQRAGMARSRSRSRCFAAYCFLLLAVLTSSLSRHATATSRRTLLSVTLEGEGGWSSINGSSVSLPYTAQAGVAVSGLSSLTDTTGQARMSEPGQVSAGCRV